MSKKKNRVKLSELYATICTYDQSGKQIGPHKVVDMYHFGTRDWVGKHLFWATHNNCIVEVQVSTEDEIEDYIASGVQKLAQKHNSSDKVLDAVPTSESLMA